MAPILYVIICLKIVPGDCIKLLGLHLHVKKYGNRNLIVKIEKEQLIICIPNLRIKIGK